MTGRHRRWLLKSLPLGLVALLALVAFTGSTPDADPEPQSYRGLNDIRARHGLPPLSPSQGLVNVARIRSADMAAQGYFSHNPPGGCNYVCLLDSHGVPHAWAGENIAWNDWDWNQT